MGITYNDIIQLTTQEISVLIQGGILDINLIKNRKDKFALYRENSAIKILTGKECNEIADIFGCNETYEDITSIKGNIGNKGKVRGVVAIVRQYEDIYKVKP